MIHVEKEEKEDDEDHADLWRDRMVKLALKVAQLDLRSKVELKGTEELIMCENE